MNPRHFRYGEEGGVATIRLDRPELQGASYAVFHSGPSATADIEGVLIHGAQGVRSLSVVLAERAGNRL